MVAATNHAIAPARFILRGAPGTLWIISTSSRQMQVKTKKSLYHLSARSLVLCHMVNPAHAMALCSYNGSMKASDSNF